MYDERRKIVQVSPTELIKGPCSSQELEAMLCVAPHTSMRVTAPKVHRTYQRKDGMYIAMDFASGERLDHIWLSLSERSGVRLSSRSGITLRVNEFCPHPMSPSHPFVVAPCVTEPLVKTMLVPSLILKISKICPDESGSGRVQAIVEYTWTIVRDMPDPCRHCA